MTYVIAEIGNNHEGSPERAIRLVQSAIATGVSAVKLQLFRAETLVNKTMPALVNGEYTTQYERMKSLELPWEVYEEASRLTRAAGKDFVLSVFDVELLEKAEHLIDRLKIASGELTHKRMLKAAAEFPRPVILSTGMAEDDEILAAVDIACPAFVLHCVSIYPCHPNYAHLLRIAHLRKLIGDRYPCVYVGYSDHCVGYHACLAAIVLGATVIEKHFRDDDGGQVGDHVHSLDYTGMLKFLDRAALYESLLSNEKHTTDYWMRHYLRRGKSGLRGDPL